jgi:Fe-S-cluster containining protein
VTLFEGWVMHLLTTGEEVFIPFVCRRCGKCCREVSISSAYFVDPEVQLFLNMGAREVIEKYVGEVTHQNDKEVTWMSMRPIKPCPFFDGDRCVIYPVRSGPCRSYPLLTDFGVCGVDCPGKRDLVRAAKRLGRGIPYYCEGYVEDEKTRVRVRPERWARTLAKYSASDPSEEALRIFIMVNDPLSQTEARGREARP